LWVVALLYVEALWGRLTLKSLSVKPLYHARRVNRWMRLKTRNFAISRAG
jgi:hypothetical protein